MKIILIGNKARMGKDTFAAMLKEELNERAIIVHFADVLKFICKSYYNWDGENKKPLYLAFQKYGLENFSFEIIEECEPEQLNLKEQYWIDYYDSYNNGYNMTSGGETNYGDNHPGHKLTKQDVIDIRTRYANLERRKEVYLLYNQRIGESGLC